jgi:aminoglycoside phosphotransferase family enzyme
MSYVFLADDFVYKIKKPVNLGYLDYTTLGNREAFCRKEVELNRRLCPDTYLGVMPISRTGQRFRIGGEGEALEYTVKMRRLPEEAMLNVLLEKEQVTPAMLAEVAVTLAGFHKKAATSDAISEFGSLQAITYNTEENFTQTEKYIGTAISPETYENIKTYTNDFLNKDAPLFRRRVSEGRIRDCHGDLHAAHVCFHNGICIFDCIEFNDRFRYSDVASEVAFLAMDLDHYGRFDLSAAFVNAYLGASDDRDLSLILNFYKGYRAYVRGKVACFQHDDPYISAEEKAKSLANARAYFKLAEAYI